MHAVNVCRFAVTAAFISGCGDNLAPAGDTTGQARPSFSNKGLVTSVKISRIDLGVLGANNPPWFSKATAISNNGLVTGTMYSPTYSPPQAFRWSATSGFIAGAGIRSDGYGINSAGIVVGRAFDAPQATGNG